MDIGYRFDGGDPTSIALATSVRAICSLASVHVARTYHSCQIRWTFDDYTATAAEPAIVATGADDCWYMNTQQKKKTHEDSVSITLR